MPSLSAEQAKDIWPSSHEVADLVAVALDAPAFRANYSNIKNAPGELWQAISGFATGEVYDWPESTYIAEPPYFDGFTMTAGSATGNLKGARPLAIFGDSVTTDHISPAGSIQEKSPAGQWLIEHGITKLNFNSFGSRRGNHEVMMRGTFGNVRIKNLMLPPMENGNRREGGYTLYQPDGQEMSIFDAAMKYQQAKVPAIVIGGEEYGTGSSRDWAAKGTQLLGVKAVVARSFERIHRSNLIGMAVLPLQFTGGGPGSCAASGAERTGQYPAPTESSIGHPPHGWV